MQVKEAPRVYPVVIVGSGAAGGMAAWNLTQKGIDVVVLDAGEKFDKSGTWEHMPPWERAARIHKGERPLQWFLSTREQPYVTPEGRPFDLVRVWGHGGKTNTWGRVSLRYAELDFKSADRDGWEIPWPISYADVAPYYDKVEELIGVCGGTDDSEVLPGSKFLQPVPPPRCGERILWKAATGMGIPMVPGRRANMTRTTRGFAPCHYCGRCGDGCATSSFFNWADHLLPFALQTGKMEIRSNAVAARVLVDDRGLARGVQYFDRKTGVEREVLAKVVVVGASCMDSTRILLNSRSERYPNGIGNGSDVIGRYLCEQVRIDVKGVLYDLYGTERRHDKGIGGEHVYMLRFNLKAPHKRDYLRGFGMQFWNTGSYQDGAPVAYQLPGFGAGFKREVKRRAPAWVELHPFGEVLPYADNRVTVDPQKTDRYGVPLMRIDYHIRDNERKMVAHMGDVVEEMIKRAGGEFVDYRRGEMDKMGSAIHEHSTCRMGADPKRSALNAWNQMHEVKNVFVVDGSSFTTASEKNPTLTILALSWRATDYLAAEMRKGNL